jgi:hypothetical protein
MATKTRRDDELRVCLVTHAQAWRVLKRGAKLAADDPAVLAAPGYFVREGASDAERAAASTALHEAQATAPRELPAAEAKRRKRKMREAKVKLRRRREQTPPWITGEIGRPRTPLPTGRERWWE